MDILKYVDTEFGTRNDLPDFQAGDTITVYYEIKEGKKYVLSFIEV